MPTLAVTVSPAAKVVEALAQTPRPSRAKRASSPLDLGKDIDDDVQTTFSERSLPMGTDAFSFHDGEDGQPAVASEEAGEQAVAEDAATSPPLKTPETRPSRRAPAQLKENSHAAAETGKKNLHKLFSKTPSPQPVVVKKELVPPPPMPDGPTRKRGRQAGSTLPKAPVVKKAKTEP